MLQVTRNHLRLHLIVFIYGFTAILGRLITFDAALMVWYRMMFAFLALGVYALYRRYHFNFSKKDFFFTVFIGLIVAVHWITFFHSIKISNVSVALGCFASTTLFASLLEPIILRRKLNWIEVFIGLVIIAGLYLIFRFETKYMAGIIMSLISAFLAALFTVFNKNLTHKYEPVQISVIELGSGWLGITAYFAFAGHFTSSFAFPGTMDLIYLLILAIICTAYAFVVSVDVMKTLSAYTVVLSVNLEPIYGIVLAFFIFGDSEYMSSGFYLGTIIILSAVFLYPVLKRKLSRFT